MSNKRRKVSLTQVSVRLLLEPQLRRKGEVTCGPFTGNGSYSQFSLVRFSLARGRLLAPAPAVRDQLSSIHLMDLTKLSLQGSSLSKRSKEQTSNGPLL